MYQYAYVPMYQGSNVCEATTWSVLSLLPISALPNPLTLETGCCIEEKLVQRRTAAEQSPPSSDLCNAEHRLALLWSTLA